METTFAIVTSSVKPTGGKPVVGPARRPCARPLPGDCRPATIPPTGKMRKVDSHESSEAGGHFDSASEARPFRVVIAEDDVLLREGLSSLLEHSGLEVVGRAGDAVQLLEIVRAQPPDLVIVDIRMPPTNTTEGLDAARVIRDEFPQVGIILLSAHMELEQAMELLESGERTGYLLKSRVMDVEGFLETLELIARGGSVVDPALVQELVSARHRHDPLEELSEREREVLALMAEGRSNAGIARTLWVTEGTVEKHVRSILSKLPLSSTADDHRRVLAVIAYLDSR
jgi:DNA-binding NarL/FixJ family response regulator